VAIVAGERLWVWDAKTGELLNPTRAGHDATIRTLAFAPDGRVFTGSLDQTIRAWDPTTGKELFSIPMLGPLGGIAVSRDGSLLAGSALGDDQRVWDSKTGKEILKLHGHGRLGGQRQVQFSADDQTLVSYGDDYFLRAFSLTSGKLTAEHRFWPSLPRSQGESEEDADKRFGGFMQRVMDFGPDGNTFVQSRGKDVEVIDIDTGKERVRFEADPQFVEALAVSADGKRLVTAGRGVPPPPPGKFADRGIGPTDFQVTVWDLVTCKPIKNFRVRAPMPRWWGPLAFTPDGKQVVTGPFEPVLRFFDATTGEAVGTIDLPNRPEAIAFDGPGKRVAIGFVDTTALIYDVSAAMKPPPKKE
jgi:WD40 repeat protein